MIGTGLAPFALPTARTARGARIERACSAYEIVPPKGILHIVAHARS